MTDGATAAGRRARSRKGEGRRLRDEILDATERLLLRAGSADGVSIRAVADAVGVTPPSIYRHFPDKATLIYEVWDRRCGTLDVACEEAIAGVDDPVERLLTVGKAYIGFGLANPEPYRLVFMDATDATPPDWRAERLGQVAAFARLIQLVQDAIDAGRLAPRYRDATRVAVSLWVHVHGLVSLTIAKPDFAWLADEGYLDEFVAAGVAGYLADPASVMEAR